MTRRLPSSIFVLALAVLAPGAPLWAQAGIEPPLLNTPVDVSPDFQDFTSTYFVADQLAEFDPATAEGRVIWKRHRFATRHAFDNTLAGLRPMENNEFPDIEYAAHPELPFSLDFVTPRTVRIRMKTGLPVRDEGLSPMLVREPPRRRLVEDGASRRRLPLHQRPRVGDGPRGALAPGAPRRRTVAS